jgi:PIN domain nuclease of toxin-antitoxin system
MVPTQSRPYRSHSRLKTRSLASPSRTHFSNAASIRPQTAVGSSTTAYSLPPPFDPDPVDRLMVATARLRDFGLVTGDEKILEYPHVETVW